MRYGQEDKQEFQKQFQELGKQQLIRKSESPYSSPTFMVRNHSKQKRGKARMVLNYEQLNSKAKFDGNYLPNEEFLLNIIQEKKYFCKFDCKSGFCI